MISVVTSRVKSIWVKAIQLGSEDCLSNHERIRIYSLNGFAVIFLVLTSVFLLAFTSLGTSLLYLPIAAIVVAVVLWMNSKRWYKGAKVTTILFLNIIVFVVAILNRRTGIEYILFTVALSSILLFDRLMPFILSFLLALIGFVGYSWYDNTYQFLPDPEINYSYTTSIILTISACVIAIQLLLFRHFIHAYATDLQKESSQITDINNKLKSSYEEEQMLAKQLDWIVSQKSKELQSYLDAINVHTYSAVTDSHGTILKANEPLINMTGFSEHELIGQNFSMLVDGRLSEGLIKELYKTLALKKTWRGELRNKKKNGSIFWIDMVVIPLMNEKGTNNYFLTLALPITERKEAEEQREKVTHMLEKIAFKASHQVRGPIARIQGLTNLMEMGCIDKDEFNTVMGYFKESVNEMDLATREMTAFVNTHYEERLSRSQDEADSITFAKQA